MPLARQRASSRKRLVWRYIWVEAHRSCIRQTRSPRTRSSRGKPEHGGDARQRAARSIRATAKIKRWCIRAGMRQPKTCKRVALVPVRSQCLLGELFVTPEQFPRQNVIWSNLLNR
ncbi:hypothetical protein SBBP2_2400016 [Burkholderiales bacterium]|nr:hypothetical protein SBBP2_2400016 [Burkholderiales bacterium]